MTATELLRRLVRMLDDDNPDYEDSGRLWDEARAFLAQPQLPEPGLREALETLVELVDEAVQEIGWNPSEYFGQDVGSDWDAALIEARAALAAVEGEP